jgi:hypothetical protein
VGGGAHGVHRVWFNDLRWGMLAAICGAHLEVAEASELVKVTLTQRVQHSACLSIVVRCQSEGAGCGCILCLSPRKPARRVCIVIVRACKRYLAVINPAHQARRVEITEIPQVVKPYLRGKCVV